MEILFYKDMAGCKVSGSASTSVSVILQYYSSNLRENQSKRRDLVGVIRLPWWWNDDDGLLVDEESDNLDEEEVRREMM